MKRLFNEQEFINDVSNLMQFDPNFKYLIPVFRATEDDSAKKIEKTKQNFIEYMKKFRVVVKFEHAEKFEDYWNFYASLNRKEMIKLLFHLDNLKFESEFFEE